MTLPLLRLGTRGSKLALTQTGLVRDALAAAVPALATPGAIEILAIKTTGDAIQDRPLSEAGGKGLFVKEIEEALLARRIHAAVHSMKDMPTAQPPGLAISAFLPREDTRDVLIAGDVTRIADLKQGAVVGGLTPQVIKFNAPGKGDLYRLVIGPFADRSAATDVCAQLKAQGRDCIVNAN